MAAILKVTNPCLSLFLTASVNRNCAVTLTTNPKTLSSTYYPFFTTMTKKLHQSFPISDNIFNFSEWSLRNVQLIILNLPLSILPSGPADLIPSLLELICNANDVPIFGARFFAPDLAKRELKRTISVVVAVDLLHVLLMRESIFFFSRAHSVAPAYSGIKFTQCKKCYYFGHSAPL